MTNELKKQIALFYRSDEDLEERMKELATVFLYGGYINVRDQYHIYLRIVEFYYHEEDGDVKDLIMYHRNNYTVAGKIPYFKCLSFNSHDTGVDITFENEQKKIRASVLIRAYEVLDVKNKKWLFWNTEKQQFQVNEEGRKLLYNTQSLYVKKFLNGFASESKPDIYWIDVPYMEEINDADISSIKRQGVYISSSKEMYKPNKTKRDKRLWGFRREKDIAL